MTIAKKLYVGFGAALLISMIMGGVSIYNLNNLGNELMILGTTKTHLLYLASDVNNSTTDMLGAVRGMNLRAHMNEPEETRKLYELTKTDSARLRKEAGEFVQTTHNADLRDELQTKVLDKQADLSQLIDQDFDLLSHNNLAGADALLRDKLLPVVDTASAAGEDVAQGETKYIAAYSEQAISTIAPARNLNVGMMLLAVLVGVGVIWVVHGINVLLQGSIVELNDGAEQVATAAGQVSSSSQSLAQGASEQAASLEETSASSEEINSMARKNTDNSRSTAELLARSQDRVNQANKYLEDMVVSMNLITDSSGKISKIIKVIDEIAFQTNILALNAAVEAARAGEAGMGFAVVADEVRSLAQRSAQAAKDTAILIEDSITRSNEGKAKVDQVALAIREVTEDSVKVKVMVDEVSLGSEEQSRGIDQIGRAISQMEQVTQTNAASAEESAAAAEELSAQSETLKDVIGRLHEMVGGGGQTSRIALRAPRRRTASSAFHPRDIAPAKSVRSNAFSAKTQARQVSGNTKPTAAQLDSFPMEENFQSF